jgi:hypothetical protein
MTVKSPIDYLLTPDENVCVRRPCSPFLTETVQEYQVPLQEENACDILPHVSSYIQNDSFKEDQTKHESKNTHTPLSSTNSIESPVGFNYPLSLFTGCRRVDMYHRFKKLSEGTYGEVYKAQCKDTAEIVVCFKYNFDYIEYKIFFGIYKKKTLVIIFFYSLPLNCIK